jgi:hypothetical protein
MLFESNVGAVRAQFLGTNFVTGNADGASAATPSALAIGTGASATDLFTTAVGQGASAGDIAATAVGADASATHDGSIAVGTSASATNNYAMAIGTHSEATGGGAIAIGLTHASNLYAVAIGGAHTTASGESSIAVGDYASASGYGSLAMGRHAAATSDRAIALGTQASATGYGSTAIGSFSQANSGIATAVGNQARALYAGSTALGQSSATTRERQMMLGTADNAYTAPGITSAESRSYQQGVTQLVTTDVQGNLAAASYESMGLASAADIERQGASIERNSEGVSMAMALSGVADILPAGTNYAVSTNWGYFESESALALGGSARLIDNVFINGGGAISTSSGVGGGRAGVTFAW